MAEFDRVREEVCHHARRMWQQRLVAASGGNVSARVDAALIAITPSRLPYETMEPADIVIVDRESRRTVASHRTPSYELPMHLAIYRSRPDVAAIVHTHAPFVTTLSVLQRPLPPVIDEMSVYLGGTVEVARYAFTGTEELGDNVVKALGDRAAAILGNHGNVCVGRDLEKAMQAALVMEAAAQAYVQALMIGEPVPLPDSAVSAGRRMFEERR